MIENIESFLIDNGFRPIIDAIASTDEFFELLDDSYDLILTDYHMNDMDGKAVVEKVRGSDYSILTEILFYTAKADLTDTKKISRVSFLETNTQTGSHQDVLIQEIKNLIGLTIKKFQHIVAMRGMIMHETSSLDAQMLAMIKDYIDDSKNNSKIPKIADPIFNNLQKQFDSKVKEIKTCKNTNNLKQITKDPFIFSAAYKIQALGAILKILEQEDFSGDYDENINRVRNKFAHAVLTEDSEGRKFFKNGDVTFDEELCKKIRKDIIKHEGNFAKLKAILGSP